MFCRFANVIVQRLAVSVDGTNNSAKAIILRSIFLIFLITERSFGHLYPPSQGGKGLRV